MSATKLLPVLRRLGHSSDDPDPVLLQRFVADRDEAAFATIVDRHGRLVLNVCRCVLGNLADAEDAFQATFLTLSRNAATIRKVGSLASWLHGVAYRIAAKARTAATRRRTHEARVPNSQSHESNDRTWGEVQQALHEELLGLPECLRAALVLVYLEGRSQDQAAAALGIKPDAVKKRLERGRKQLRTRLGRRGYGPVVMLAALSVPGLIVPSALASMVVRQAGTPAGIPATILDLAESGVETMSFTNLKALSCLVPALVVSLALAAGSGRPIPASTILNDLTPKHIAGRVPEAESPAEAETRWIAGEWRVKSVQTNDAELFKPEELAEARIVFNGKTATVKNMKVLWMGDFTFTLDPTKTPKEIDVVFPGGPQRDKTYKGIYVIRQKEMLIGLRLLETHLPRPAGYFPTRGSGLYRFHLEPVEAKQPPPPSPKAPEPVKPNVPAKPVAKTVTDARLVIRGPIPLESGVQLYRPYIEFEWSYGGPKEVSFNPRDVVLVVRDDRGNMIPESKRPRPGAVHAFVTGKIPPMGYVGLPVTYSGLTFPFAGSMLASGSQDWDLIPGTYTARGSVLAVLDYPFHLSRNENALSRGEPTFERVKVELKPVTFVVGK